MAAEIFENKAVIQIVKACQKDASVARPST
jgi:hypothetical protein